MLAEPPASPLQAAEGLGFLRAAQALRPHCAGVYCNLSVALYALDRLPEAAAACRRALQLQPKLARARCNLAQFLYNLGQVPEAIGEFRQALRDQPDLVEAHNNLGNVLRILGNLPEAAAEFHEAIRLDPRDPEIHYNLGQVFKKQGKWTEALEAFQETIRLQPDMAQAHVELGGMLYKQGKRPEAEAAFRQALKLAPKDGWTLNLLAWLFATAQDPGLQRPAEAVALAQRAVKLKPANPDYWNTLGVAHYRQGDIKGAIEALTKSLGLRQGGGACNEFFLAMAHWQAGDKVRARKEYDQGTAWMDRNDPRDEELCHFRSEAEEVLGLKAAREILPGPHSVP